MNSGKKSTAIIVAVLAIIVIVAIVWAGKSQNGVVTEGELISTTTASVPVSETTKVSNTISEYQNAELGFLVKYPSVWEREELNAGVNFIVPIDKDQVSTVATLQATVQVSSDTCEFPPVLTVKDRSTLKVGDLDLNTISMENTVQGREYYNRIYLLKQNGVCYKFLFTSIALAPSSKNLTGSEATQAANNNKAIVSSTEAAFTEMVKSFTFVEGPEGKDETKVAPAANQ